MNLNDKPLIWWVISRLKRVKELDNIIVATTKKKDDKLINWLKKIKLIILEEVQKMFYSGIINVQKGLKEIL